MFNIVYDLHTYKFVKSTNLVSYKLHKKIKVVDLLEINDYIRQNDITEEKIDVQAKIDEYTKQIVKIQQWWKWDIYYHPHTEIGMRRLEREYEELYN